MRWGTFDVKESYLSMAYCFVMDSPQPFHVLRHMLRADLAIVMFMERFRFQLQRFYLRKRYIGF